MLGFGSSATAVAELQSVPEANSGRVAEAGSASSEPEVAGFVSLEAAAYASRRVATQRPETLHRSLLSPAIHSCSAGKAPGVARCCAEGSATKLAWQGVTVCTGAHAVPCVAKGPARQPFAPAPTGQGQGANLSLARQGL